VNAIRDKSAAGHFRTATEIGALKKIATLTGLTWETLAARPALADQFIHAFHTGTLETMRQARNALGNH